MTKTEIITGDVAKVCRALPVASFDAVLCDPPYGLSFMGKDWDGAVPDADTWRAVHWCLRPGGHLMAFGGTRTWHRLAVAIEDAGFGIRDTLCWLYGSGFPKSHNGLGEAHAGYGTALKPAWEPVVLARKGSADNVADTCQKYGTGALNIDGARIGTAADMNPNDFDDSKRISPKFSGLLNGGKKGEYRASSGEVPDGRWPANVVLDEEAGRLLDAQSGETNSVRAARGGTSPNPMSWHEPRADGDRLAGYADSGGASRFFYCAKASRSEREAGLEGLPWGEVDRRNQHPTVKPLDLCRWLATLLLPPPGHRPRRLLVPFSGSGSEMIGAQLAGWDEVVGIELSYPFKTIAKARLEHWAATNG